jgi:hypothetical protein
VIVAVAAVGVPGLAAFDARTSLVELALDGPFVTVVLIATLAPIAYYARLLVVGLRRPDRIGGPDSTWLPRFTPVDVTNLGPWLRTTAAQNRGVATAGVALAMALLALGTAAGGFGGPAAAAGLPPALDAPTEFFVPE